MFKKGTVILLALVILAGTISINLSASGSLTDSSSDSSTRDHYTRSDDFPKIIKLPLQYIDSSTGHKIAVRVAAPANKDGSMAAGKFPVLLVQSAYNVGLIYDIPASLMFDGGIIVGMPDPYFIKKGYIIVSVDAIGGGVSEGGWELLGKEEQQGYGDVVDWVKTQDWYDGNMGVIGASYMAITALFTAQQRPEDIKVIFAALPIGDAMRGIVGTGGLFNGLFIKTWASITHATAVMNVFNEWQHTAHEALIEKITQRHIEQLDKYHLPTLEKAISGDPMFAYDSEFWRTRSPLEGMDRIKAPIFLVGAVHDIFQRDAPMLYKAVKEQAESRLLVYDGTHISNFESAMMGTEASSPMINLELQWLDAYLKGIDTGIENIPPVSLFVKNYKNGSREGFDITDDWPHPKADPQRWYLHSNKLLSKSPPKALSLEESKNTMKASEAADISYGKTFFNKLIDSDIKFKDGSDCSFSFVQWTLGEAELGLGKSCYSNHAIVQENALNFDSEPMVNDYYINGPMQLDVWVSSTKENAVISVRVDEVEGKGNGDIQVNPISNGLLLVSLSAVDESRSMFVKGEMIQPYHYLTKEKEKLLASGEIRKVSVEVFPSSVLIRKGNRLRVSIAPSNQAQGILNKPRVEQVKGGVTTIHSDEKYLSSLVVLSVPLDELD